MSTFKKLNVSVIKTCLIKMTQGPSKLFQVETIFVTHCRAELSVCTHGGFGVIFQLWEELN